MRWLFYGLLALNFVYCVWNLAAGGRPLSGAAAVLQAEVPGRRLVLLSEPEGAVPAMPEHRRVEHPALCWVVGPWPDPDHARRWMGEHGLIAGQGELKTIRVKRDRLSWVYLPPGEGGRDAALETLKELQAQSVDSFLVSEGDDAMAISLGYFASAESAKGLQRKMQSAGYPAQVRETWRELAEYWYYHPLTEGEEVGRLALAAQQASLEMSRAACATD